MDRTGNYLITGVVPDLYKTSCAYIRTKTPAKLDGDSAIIPDCKNHDCDSFKSSHFVIATHFVTITLVQVDSAPKIVTIGLSQNEVLYLHFVTARNRYTLC